MTRMEPNPYQSPALLPEPDPKCSPIADREHPLVEAIIATSFGVLVLSLVVVIGSFLLLSF
jgi:hypothetical protein